MFSNKEERENDRFYKLEGMIKEKNEILMKEDENIFMESKDLNNAFFNDYKKLLLDNIDMFKDIKCDNDYHLCEIVENIILDLEIKGFYVDYKLFEDYNTLTVLSLVTNKYYFKFNYKLKPFLIRGRTVNKLFNFKLHIDRTEEQFKELEYNIKNDIDFEIDNTKKKELIY